MPEVAAVSTDATGHATGTVAVGTAAGSAATVPATCTMRPTLWKVRRQGMDGRDQLLRRPSWGGGALLCKEPLSFAVPYELQHARLGLQCFTTAFAFPAFALTSGGEAKSGQIVTAATIATFGFTTIGLASLELALSLGLAPILAHGDTAFRGASTCGSPEPTRAGRPSSANPAKAVQAG